ncbi:hypothetical protein SAMN04487906_0525 [Zhouia amylolytica]|uniref:DUF4190 domain-containing protein n=2 Tax=Zhouia amylolytica TaxID=376730 RepID=W2URK1_9FLAO|nr:CCC motif membrane protein [Zhouia amylolytica]ETN96111.1 hypothetical protein P278_18330 [Zhouia amylolytica AD3]MCQ0112981.1 DUF4190 domain-containing protein [Zhouia amylolytica]SFS49151.1 hypothetical protein SAMN04487906_0525 [Zhouia amylolytica]
MEQTKLPNATIVLVLGILSFIGCCCTNGFAGLVLGGIGLFLAKKDEKLYRENPENYSNYGQLKTGRVLSIIGIVLSVLAIAFYIYAKSTGMYEELMEQYMEQLEQLQ